MAFESMQTNVTIPSSEGMLSAVIHKPETERNKLAVLCPGYLDSKEYKNIVGLAEELAKRGYTVVRFDPTGTWESEGDISKYTVTQCIEDVRNVVHYMKEKKALLDDGTYGQILVGGHSRGATVALLYAAKDPTVTSVLAIMPKEGKEAENLHRYAEWKKTNDRVSYRDLPEDPSKEKEFHVPFSYAQDADKYDVAEEIKKTGATVVLIAGELDDTCTPESIKKIYDNARYISSEFTIIPGIDHDYRQRGPEIKIVNDATLNLLAKHERSLSRST